MTSVPHRISLVALAVLAAVACGGGGGGGASLPAHTSFAVGNATIEVDADPFVLRIKDAQGATLVETLGAGGDDGAPYASMAATHIEPRTVGVVLYGWDYFRGDEDPWRQLVHVTSVATNGDTRTFTLASSDGARAELRIEAGVPSGVHLVATTTTSSSDGAGSATASANELSLAFKMHDDAACDTAATCAPGDHFFGFGERFVNSDQRGHRLTTWVEDGGFGHGEGTPPGIGNPSPSGEGQTNLPIPWLLSPRGFAMLQNTSARTTYHLGEERPDAWRVEQIDPARTDGASFDATIFVDPDPKKLVEALTSITGRPPEIADWVLAPRRRANPGTDEMDKLRQAHVPTSVIDTAVHYFPNGDGGKPFAPGALRAVTDDLHARGFKAVAYFCPFVADSFHPVFDDAVAKGFLVKKKDGSPYTVLDPPYNAGMVDFTNPAAVAWYQGFLKGALDDGWDGFMVDFGEYVPSDAVMSDGTSGYEAHNAYPVLYQRAAHDLFERERRGDYLVFVRSGYTGTSGLVPMVWAGDQSTDFDLADGLPAALTGALNAGLSGIPLWGSDISGYHYVFNPPPDKEVYLRWTEVAAFSADMHDENDGAGNGPSSDRWQIWKDQETLDVYSRYAALKTQLVPYVQLAVAEAQARGLPVMRHLLFEEPKNVRVYGVSDEYLLGDALLVAPVVSRGATTRRVHLPPGAWFDFFARTARVVGNTDVDVPAPLDAVPVFARAGAIVPLLWNDVETVAPVGDGSAVSQVDRRDRLEARIFAAGDADVTLRDGTHLVAHAPSDPFDVGPAADASGALPVATSEVDARTCGRCVYVDGASRTLVVGEDATASGGAVAITAGPLQVSANSATVKRYLFVVRY